MSDTSDMLITPASGWKKSGDSAKKGGPLKLPSGNTCLAIAPGAEVFIKLGMIPNSLLEIVQGAIQKASRKQAPPDFSKIATDVVNDTKKMQELMVLVDRVALFCVQQPVILDVPEHASDRDDEALYIDEVDLEDKFFVFQWAVGGTRDLESFRQEQAAGVGPVPAGEELEVSP